MFLILLYITAVNCLLKDLDGRFPMLDGQKHPLTVDIDVSKFNSDMHKILSEDLDKEITAKINAYVNRTQFQDVIEKEIKRQIKNITGISGIGGLHNNYKDCTDIKNRSLPVPLILPSGVYEISPGNFTGLKVYCDMMTDNGGWTVIQRRTDANLNFNRVWTAYEDGFGNVSGDFWLGNKYVHAITSNGKYELRIDLEMMDHNKKVVVYKTFRVGDAKSKYQLTATDFVGRFGDDYFKYLSGQKFTTKDQDNDLYPRNCAAMYGGGWWYRACYHTTLLTGQYGSSDGFRWNGQLRTSVMMIRRL